MKKYFIGADVSKKTLDCVLYDDNSLKMKESHIKITNDREGRDWLVEWMKGLGVTVKDAIVCMEYTGIYSYGFAELLAKKKIDFTMIPPLKIKGAFAGARGKNDKVDAMRIATYANRYKDEIKPMSLKDDKIVELRNLMNDRKMAVKCAAAYKNVMAEYKNRKHDYRYKDAKEFVDTFDKKIKKTEKEILKLIAGDTKLEHNYRLLVSIPGISLVNAVNLIVFTCNFSAFDDPRKFASYAGVAPFEYTSGTSVNRGTHVSKMANVMLKADLSMAAKAAAIHDSGLKKYFEKKKAEGKSYGCVINAVKFKLICRAFAVIRHDKPYVIIEKDAA